MSCNAKFNTGWAVLWSEHNQGVAIYTIQNNGLWDFQPMLKRIIEDAFDTKVRQWLNSIDYVEETEEQDRIRDLVHKEIGRFHSWMFGGKACSETATSLYQTPKEDASLFESRFVLLADPQMDILKDADVSANADASRVLLQSGMNTVRTAKVNAIDAIDDKWRMLLPEDAEICNYPLMVAMYLSGDENEKELVYRLFGGAASGERSRSCDDIVKSIRREKKFWNVLPLWENMAVATDQVLFGNQAPKTAEVIQTSISEYGVTDELMLWERCLRPSVEGVSREKCFATNYLVPDRQKEIIGDNWRSFFVSCLETAKEQAVCDSFGRPIRMDNFLGKFCVDGEELNENGNWKLFCDQIKPAGNPGRTQALALLGAGALDCSVFPDLREMYSDVGVEPGTVDTVGMQKIYDVFVASRQDQQDRRYRLGDDLLSMHDINPLCHSFYESARLEAYFRAKSAETRTFKKRRVEDAFSNFDDEFARVAHRKDVYRHPLAERQKEFIAVMNTALRLLVASPASLTHWMHHKDNCWRTTTERVAGARSFEYFANERRVTPVNLSEAIFQQPLYFGKQGFLEGLMRGLSSRERRVPQYWRPRDDTLPEEESSVETHGGHLSWKPSAPPPPAEFILLPASSGGEVLGEVYVDLEAYWMCGDTFSLFSDALSLVIKLVNNYKSKAPVSWVEHEDDGSGPDPGNLAPPGFSDRNGSGGHPGRGFSKTDSAFDAALKLVYARIGVCNTLMSQVRCPPSRTLHQSEDQSESDDEDYSSYKDSAPVDPGATDVSANLSSFPRAEYNRTNANATYTKEDGTDMTPREFKKLCYTLARHCDILDTAISKLYCEYCGLAETVVKSTDEGTCKQDQFFLTKRGQGSMSAYEYLRIKRSRKTTDANVDRAGIGLGATLNSKGRVKSFHIDPPLTGEIIQRGSMHFVEVGDCVKFAFAEGAVQRGAAEPAQRTRRFVLTNPDDEDNQLQFVVNDGQRKERPRKYHINVVSGFVVFGKTYDFVYHNDNNIPYVFGDMADSMVAGGCTFNEDNEGIFVEGNFPRKCFETPLCFYTWSHKNEIQISHKRAKGVITKASNGKCILKSDSRMIPFRPFAFFSNLEYYYHGTLCDVKVPTMNNHPVDLTDDFHFAETKAVKKRFDELKSLFHKTFCTSLQSASVGKQSMQIGMPVELWYLKTGAQKVQWLDHPYCKGRITNIDENGEETVEVTNTVGLVRKHTFKNSIDGARETVGLQVGAGNESDGVGVGSDDEDGTSNSDSDDERDFMSGSDDEDGNVSSDNDDATSSDDENGGNTSLGKRSDEESVGTFSGARFSSSIASVGTGSRKKKVLSFGKNAYWIVRL